MTDCGCWARDDMMDRTRARPMQALPEIHVARVRTVVACRPPRSPSVMAAPPPTAARPPPLPDCRRITIPRRIPSRTRMVRRNAYIVPPGCLREKRPYTSEGGAGVSTVRNGGAARGGISFCALALVQHMSEATIAVRSTTPHLVPARYCG